MDPAERFARSLHLATKKTADNAAYSPPIVNTSIYALPPDPGGPYQYARWGNPTWTALEDALSVLEDAETLIFPSGMAATAAVLYSSLRPGDKLLLPADGYYTTRVFAERYLAPMGVQVDTCATAALEAHPLQGYALVWIETPANPGLDLADIAAVSAKAHEHGALVVVDNTMMTPLGQRPLEQGADLLVSADTKALNGHSDVLFGHVSSRRADLMEGVRDWRRVAGCIPGPFEAWLVHRGLETLEVRWSRMCANAQMLAERLSEMPQVRVASYPGLPTHPQQALANRQMHGGGSIIGLTLKDKDSAEQFIAQCDFLRAATSFGGVHSSAERRARWGDKVADGFVRLSVGCEPVDALWDACKRALLT
jgi:cystathionine gamma-lyase